MLARIAMKFDCLAESGEKYNPESDYDYEHRCAESYTSFSVRRFAAFTQACSLG